MRLVRYAHCSQNQTGRAQKMRILMLFLATMTLVSAALADGHDSAEAEVRAAAEAFNTAYATNDVESYFGAYADDATVFFFGERQDMAAYREFWSGMIDAGGGVEVNEMSDVVIQMMPGNDVAIATYFVDNRTRSPEGEITKARAFETDVWQKIDGNWRIVSLHYTEIP